MYKIQKISQKNIAKCLGVSIDTVVRNLREYHIDSNSNSDWTTNYLELNTHQLTVLNGAMLGDGCLYLGKNSANAQFCYASKSRQHVEFICKEFMKWSYREGIKYNSYNDKRTNKTYSRYTYRSICGTGFTTEYNRWYNNGTKHIPKDLKLTPLICLIWYLGDGGINHSNRGEHIKLSTQCFLKTELEKILIPQLQQFNPQLMKADVGLDGVQQYYIYIPHIKEKEFLDYIGECPFDDYKYKWNISGYKNCIPQNHTDKEKIFCDMFRMGMTYYSIAKEFKIEPNAVKYYLKKNNLYRERPTIKSQVDSLKK